MPLHVAKQLMPHFSRSHCQYAHPPTTTTRIDILGRKSKGNRRINVQIFRLLSTLTIITHPSPIIIIECFGFCKQKAEGKLRNHIGNGNGTHGEFDQLASKIMQGRSTNKHTNKICGKEEREKRLNVFLSTFYRVLFSSIFQNDKKMRKAQKQYTQIEGKQRASKIKQECHLE